MLTSIAATSFSLIKLRNMTDINTGTPFFTVVSVYTIRGTDMPYVFLLLSVPQIVQTETIIKHCLIHNMMLKYNISNRYSLIYATAVIKKEVEEAEIA
jgi:hypothetical protein